MKHPLLAAVLLLGLQGETSFAQGGPPETAVGSSLFTFHNGFWVNLHHFLYVLGRARNGAADSQRRAVRKAQADLDGFSSLSEQERQAWADAIAHYSDGPSKQDVIFDRELIAITRALANVNDSDSLAGADLPAPLRETLERAAPIYRKVWWDRHSRSNQARIEELRDLLIHYGRPVSDMLTAIYQQRWPDAGFIVQVSAYSNWAGAYSVEGGPIVIASTDEDAAGSKSLEVIFHEAMHQWDDAIIPLLTKTAERFGAIIPRDLFHALIFYTAGYAVAQVVPGHRPYAEAMWARGSLTGHAQLVAYWLPYLRGNGTFRTSIEALVASFK
jgi:hypothetical protein